MRKVLLAAAALLFIACAGGLADTVTLMSGETIQGRIVNESPAEITIDVNVSAAISDERVIRRDEIQKIEKTSQEDLDFAAIKELKPDPLSTQPGVIDKALLVLKAFLAKYPKSIHAADVQGRIDVFMKEKSHVDAGEIKYYGRWISPAEAAKRKLQIDAAATFSKMKEQAAAGEFTNALNTFDEIEKNYGTARIYPQAVAYAVRILPVFQQFVSHSKQKLQHDMTEWTKGVTITAEPQKSQIIAAQKEEQEKYDTAMATSDKNGVKWTPVLGRSDKCLDRLMSLIAAENTRLSAIPVDKMTTSVQYVDKAREALVTNDTKSAESFLKEAVALWPQNEAASYYGQMLADLKAAEVKRAEALAKPTPVAKQSPSHPPANALQAAKPAATPLAVVPEEKPSILAFFMTIPGALSLVGTALVLLGVVAGVQKMRTPKDEEPG